MKKIISYFLIVVLIAVFAGTSFGAEDLSTEEKWQHYNSESKNPWIAAGLAYGSLYVYGIPLGHFYAGDWKRGLPFVVMLFASAYLTRAIYPNDIWDALRALALIGGAVVCWEIFDAYWTAEDYNYKLKQKYGLTSFQLLNELPGLAYLRSPF